LKASDNLLVTIITGVSSPTLYQASKDSAPIDFHALRLLDAGIPITVTSISEAINCLHEYTFRNHSFDQIHKPLVTFVQNALAHAIRKKQTHESDILESKDFLLWKKYGDLILFHQKSIPPESNELLAEDYMDTEVTYRIQLNPSLNASGNAQAYYRKYRKAKSKIDAATKFIQEDERTIEYLMSLNQAAISATDDEDIAALREEISKLGMDGRNSENKELGNGRSTPPGKSKTGKQRSRIQRLGASRAAEKNSRDQASGVKKAASSIADAFRKYANSDGTVILCGRNNIQNEALTFRTAASEDFWFHAKNRPGSHVVLRCFGKSPADDSVLAAASVAAYYSSAATDLRKSEFAPDSADKSFAVEVDYCEVKRVKKIPGAKPGMVIYDQYRTLLVHPALPGIVESSGNPA
jgi:predicted ribosome quality control (RQC) complex YloA/Tae2 family protein